MRLQPLHRVRDALEFYINSKVLAAGLLSFSLYGCSHLPELKPDPAAARAPNNPNVAFEEVAGVRVFVQGDAWNGDPKNLPELFTPVRVTIENQSNRPLRVNYGEFKLTGQSGFSYAAIPPMQAQGLAMGSADGNSIGIVMLAAYQHEGSQAHHPRERRVVVVPRIVHDRFFVAPHFAWYYPGWAAWGYPFPYDPLYYDRFYGLWPKYLPTQDMLSEALPAGVVQGGGRVTGFVYFQNIGDRERRVTFEMDLVDANNGQAFGHLSLPFDVTK